MGDLAALTAQVQMLAAELQAARQETAAATNAAQVAQQTAQAAGQAAQSTGGGAGIARRRTDDCHPLAARLQHCVDQRERAALPK